MKKENKVPGIVPDDFGFYKVKSRKYLELGERTEFLARTYFIYESVSVFDGEELMHTYTLRRAGGFQTVYGHNSGIIGASLDATILATKNDTVKVAVAVDGGQKESEAKWFPYSTVYSSPDGTGWYCMPEKGDKVRLYFPNEFEEEGYIISSINLGNTGAQSAPAAGEGRLETLQVLQGHRQAGVEMCRGVLPWQVQRQAARPGVTRIRKRFPQKTGKWYLLRLQTLL